MSDKARQLDDQPGAITALLSQLRDGNKQAEEKLIPLVYNELHRLARYYMRRERGDHTLQTSALVNEAYLRLLGEHAIDWKNRPHLFGLSPQIIPTLRV